MAWRAIQDTVGVSRSLSELSHGAERLYWRMLAYTDPWGRVDGDPVKVHARCMPLVAAEAEEVEAWLEALREAGRIVRYVEDGKAFVQFADFELHQPAELTRRRGPSKFPEPVHLQEAPGKSRSVREAPNRSRLEKKREEEKNSPPKGPPSRKPDDLWDALAAELGEPQTRSEKSRRGKVLNELRDAGATPGQVRLKASAYRKLWPKMSLTDTALAKHWTTLEAQNGQPAFTCPECGIGFQAELSLARHRSHVHDVAPTEKTAA